MWAYRIESFGSVDGISLGERPDPRPGTRELLVRVRATSLNYRDLMALKGGGRGPTRQGVVPLSDGAGEVVAVGERTSRFADGDRVIGCFQPRWFGGPIKPDYLSDRLGANLDGMLAEYRRRSRDDGRSTRPRPSPRRTAEWLLLRTTDHPGWQRRLPR
jgi:NADPH:quinone reductase-like Zn-dependent oxidoreductase